MQNICLITKKIEKLKKTTRKMHTLQQLSKASGVGVSSSSSNDLHKFLKFLTTLTLPSLPLRCMTSNIKEQEQQQEQRMPHKSKEPITLTAATTSMSRQNSENFKNATAAAGAGAEFDAVSHSSALHVNGCGGIDYAKVITATTLTKTKFNFSLIAAGRQQFNKQQQQQFKHLHTQPKRDGSSAVVSGTSAKTQQQQHQQTNQQQQQQQHHHQHNQAQTQAQSKQQQNAMSSLAAEPLQLVANTTNGHENVDGLSKAAAAETATTINTMNMSRAAAATTTNGSSCHDDIATAAEATKKQPCFNTGLAEILQFMELIGNLKHTKRTGWVLRDVNDCESISGHMYRMSMLTFLLDGSEGLNQIRCMELALVHDLAESLVGDITPFCGVSKDEKRAMEFKAMEDICKLIEPRGKRIMELFEEYEHGQSAESRFVKDLDRLDMVMQAFEYEKRDNCLLKHQEFFDSTEGKFNHPFVKKLVNEIYEQRQNLATAKGATPPPPVIVPNMESNGGGFGAADGQHTS